MRVLSTIYLLVHGSSSGPHAMECAVAGSRHLKSEVRNFGFSELRNFRFSELWNFGTSEVRITQEADNCNQARMDQGDLDENVHNGLEKCSWTQLRVSQQARLCINPNIRKFRKFSELFRKFPNFTSKLSRFLTPSSVAFG